VHAATGRRRTASAATRPAVFTPLLARIVLEPFRLHFLGLLLVLFREQPLAALVELFRFEPFLLGTATVWQYWQF